MILEPPTEAEGRKRAGALYNNILQRELRRGKNVMPMNYEATDDIMEGPFILAESDIFLLQGQGILAIQQAVSARVPDKLYPKMTIDVNGLSELAQGTRHWLPLEAINVDQLPKPGENITSGRER